MLFDLRTVGFSKPENEEKVYQVVNEVFNHFTDKYSISIDENKKFIETKKQYGKNFGVIARGFQNGDKISFKEIVPYADAAKKMPITELLIEKGDIKLSVNNEVIKNEYHVKMKNPHTGLPMQFYLQNVVEYLENSELNLFKGVYISALAQEGKVLLPVAEDEIDEIYEIDYDDDDFFDEEDEGAIDVEDLDDDDIFTLKGNWLEKMPTSIVPASDAIAHYLILGKIKSVNKLENEATGEKIYKLSVFADGITLDVYVNKKKLLGEPSPGMRFMGLCWLQGKIAF
ncbi:MAG: DUF3881 family protein [Clostridia bacterium]|nr:DUF3881 family protein [Clostridia bacterium]